MVVSGYYSIILFFILNLDCDRYPLNTKAVWSEYNRSLRLFLCSFNLHDVIKLTVECFADAKQYIRTQLAPFLSEQTLSRIAEKMGDIDLHTLVGLAPFLEEVTLDRIVKRELDKGCSIQALTPLYPFLSSETMRRLMQHFLRTGDIEGMKDAATFL